jgi:superfamily II DNA or RNA helicase
MTIHLRPYQLQALEAEDRHRAEHPDETRLAIVMATGLGKTIVLAERARRFLESERKRVLILVHTDELTQQAEAKVRLVVGDAGSVGVVKAERDETEADIIIGSVQTLADSGRRERIWDVGLVIVDECHHATAASYQAIMQHFGCFGYCPAVNCECGGIGCTEDAPFTPALGFTATLERSDGAGLGEVWQDVCFTRDISWGVRHGYLVQPIGHRMEVSTEPLAENAAWADEQLMSALAPERIVEKWMEVAAVRPTVAFMPLVRSAARLADAFTHIGISAEVIHGAMPDWHRRTVLANYEAGRVQVLVNAMVLTEGWDSPRTKCVIVGRPTRSRPLFVQMAGRGLRPIPGIPVEDQDCILLTVADATTDLCSVADLSDRPLDPAADGPLTVMEDQWDIGKELDERAQADLWTGHVDVREFDPLVQRSSKVWKHTEHGTPFLPISKDQEYVFIVGTSVFARQDGRIKRLHADLPDLGLAMSIAEDEAQERGGDLGRMLADKGRAWRKLKPSEAMRSYALMLGLDREVARIMASKAGGKAGKLSDLIDKVVATRALEPAVERIKGAMK